MTDFPLLVVVLHPFWECQLLLYESMKLARLLVSFLRVVSIDLLLLCFFLFLSSARVHRNVMSIMVLVGVGSRWICSSILLA